MLSELTIQNFAIIDQVHLRFAPGFTVLTGETGAGKSIIIDAVGLLLGGRGDPEVIRAEAGRATIEGVFSLGGEAQASIRPLLEEEGLEGDGPGLLLLAREIRREGRNICRVNGRAVSLKLLESIGQCLVDIHGQTEHLSLLRVREHVELLDRYGDLWCLREQFAGLVQELRAVRRELTELRRDERDLARRVDLLQYQVHEIEAARLQPGEEGELDSERTRLANAEQLQASADEAYQALYEGAEDQASAVDLLQAAERLLTSLARVDPSANALAKTAETLVYQLEDLVELLREYRDRIEFNPERLEQVEDRLALIHGLQRKYGDTLADVLAYAERARRDLDAIEHSGERISRLEEDEDGLLHKLGALGAELSTRRQEAGRRLAAGIEAELGELSMARARFGVDLAWHDADDGAYAEGRRVAFNATGLDRVEFLVAPNVGEPLKPLVRIASGGETSRLMLALKTVLSQADRTPTLIFDEIDAGIGGRVGTIVGQKLWGLTVKRVGNGQDGQQDTSDAPRVCHQVLCVTHLPQLACYGDEHFHVRKGIVGDRTVTQVKSLTGEEREQELAGMLGIVTDRTRASAREMLSSSREEKTRLV